MVTKTFGELLYRSESHLKEFPSPESLKKKILISTKPPKELHEASSSAKDETWNVNGEHEVRTAWIHHSLIIINLGENERVRT